MHPKEQILADIKEAMKAGDKTRRDILRQLSAAFKQSEVDQQKELTADDALKILQKEAKRRQESIADFTKAGRDVSDIEAELALIESYLPEQLSKEKIAVFVKEAIAEVGATSPADMGKVMQAVMSKVQGQADGKVVSQVVREHLA